MQQPIKTQNLQRWLTRGIVIVALVLAILLPLFVKSDLYRDKLITTMIFGVLAMTFIMMLRTGLISLGIAAFWGIGAYSSAVLTAKLGLSFWAALPLSALAAALVAFLLGFLLIGRGGVFSFVILTAVLGMLFSATVGAIGYVGGTQGMFALPAPGAVKVPGLPAWDFNSVGGWYYLALALTVVAALICYMLYKSWVGRAWTSIGLNPKLAASIGVGVFRYRLLSFVIASGIAGLIGSFYANYMTTIRPQDFEIWVNINIQAYAILGGIGYAIAGPILGSGILQFLPEALRSISDYSDLVTGAVLVLLILFLPTGVLGLLSFRKNGLTNVRRNIARIGEFFSPSKADRLATPVASESGNPPEEQPWPAIQMPATGDDSTSSISKAGE